MGRTREFDYAESVERGMRLFWKSGYEGTSLRDLLDGMGIGESSFYNALKNKKNAYLECLKHYNETVNAVRGRAFFEAPTAALGVRGLFGCVLECLDDPSTPSLLCMMAGSMTSDVLEEPDLREYIQEQMAKLAVCMAERFKEDQQMGLLPEKFEPELTASVVITYMQGLWRMALISYDRARFEQQIDMFLISLGL